MALASKTRSKEAMVHERKLSKLLKARGYVVKAGLGDPFSNLKTKPQKDNK